MSKVPLKEILFAAKTGFISKQLWTDFFTQRSRSRNYRIWRGFQEDEYFKPHENRVLKDVLVLAPKSIKLLRNYSISPVTRPHINQFDHDEKAARIALSLEAEQLIASYLTEAELKKGSITFWNQRTQRRGAKYPDLLVNLPDSAKYRRVAIEVEQSIKSFERYKQSFINYSSQGNFDFILFASDYNAIFNRLSLAMEAVHFPTWDTPIGYTNLTNFLRKPGCTTIHLHSGVTTFEQWLPKDTTDSCATTANNDVSLSEEKIASGE